MGDLSTVSPIKILETRSLVWTGGIRITGLFRESKMQVGSLAL